MAVPTLLPTTAQNEKFGGVTYHIEGELVPAVHIKLTNTGVGHPNRRPRFIGVGAKHMRPQRLGSQEIFGATNRL